METDPSHSKPTLCPVCLNNPMGVYIGVTTQEDMASHWKPCISPFHSQPSECPVCGSLERSVNDQGHHYSLALRSVKTGKICHHAAPAPAGEVKESLDRLAAQVAAMTAFVDGSGAPDEFLDAEELARKGNLEPSPLHPGALEVALRFLGDRDFEEGAKLARLISEYAEGVVERGAFEMAEATILRIGLERDTFRAETCYLKEAAAENAMGHAEECKDLRAENRRMREALTGAKAELENLTNAYRTNERVAGRALLSMEQEDEIRVSKCIDRADQALSEGSKPQE